MMHRDVLDPVEKKHVLRPIFEPRLQHGVAASSPITKTARRQTGGRSVGGASATPRKNQSSVSAVAR